MRVFITGASGHIASGVIPELLAEGHEVIGLARSEAAAEAVSARGARVQRGDLDDLDVLYDTARQSDGEPSHRTASAAHAARVRTYRFQGLITGTAASEKSSTLRVTMIFV